MRTIRPLKLPDLKNNRQICFFTHSALDLAEGTRLLTLETITNTILHCDCVEGMKKMPDACIDLTVTSPPYDEIRTCFNLLPLPKFKEVAQELLRITKPGGVVACPAGDVDE